MKVTAVIPARLASTRLPRKVLADIGGLPMLQHVWQRVQRATSISDVYIATDSQEVADAAEKWGSNVLMTSPDCRSGTERIASALPAIGGDFILNVQGDEPLIDPALLDEIVNCWKLRPADIVTPIFQIGDMKDLLNPNVVKVVRSQQGFALYFSRSPIPYLRDTKQEYWLEQHTFWGHIGVYGYGREVLQAYLELPASSLETAERLEQLRFLEAGFRIQTVETTYRSVSVDTNSDLENVRKMLGVT